MLLCQKKLVNCDVTIFRNFKILFDVVCVFLLTYKIILALSASNELLFDLISVSWALLQLL